MDRLITHGFRVLAASASTGGVPEGAGPPASTVGPAADGGAGPSADGHDFYRTAFEAAPIGMALVDPDGRYLRVNDALCAFTGHPAERLTQMHFQEISHPDDLEEDLALLAQLHDDVIPTYQMEKRYRHADGYLVTALLSVSCIRDELGAVRRYVRQMKDITERKAAEQEAARYREQLDMAQELAHVGSFTFDPVDRSATWSPGLFRITGRHPRFGPLGFHAFVTAYVHPGDRDVVRSAFVRTMRLGEPFDQRFRVVHTRLGVRTVQGQAGMVGRGEHGTQLLGVLQDLTDRVALQAARDDAEVRFAAVFESAPIGVCLVDLRVPGPGTVTRANPAFGALTGRPDAELTDTLLSDVVVAEDRHTIAEALERLQAGAPRVQLEVRIRGGEGQDTWTLVTGAPIGPPGAPASFAVAQLVDISDRKGFEGRLRHMADHDALTGLFNRRRFDEELVKALGHADRYGSHGAVLLADLDGFKLVNDSFGHSAGDELLSQVAAVLRGALRGTDVLARIGGDEFAVLLPQTDEAEATRVATKLLRTIRVQVQSAGEGRPARIAASIGISCFEPYGDLSAEDLMAEADAAMYDAKEAGRATVRVFRAVDRRRERVTERARWITRLQAALEHDRFRLLAQPIIGICGNGVPRAELLLRYVDDDGSLVTPSNFLYLAERYDLMRRIDRWVLGQAVAILRREHARGRDVALSVNVSGRTLVDESVVGELASLLADAPFPAERLIIEVTETAAITNIERARVFADRLHELGCRFSLDDFGAGFASFYYLKHLRFDEIKIDGEFVRQLPDSPVDELVIDAVVRIARGLGTRTVAEFVGSDATLAALRRLGVDYGQGLHLAPPMELDDLFPSSP